MKKTSGFTLVELIVTTATIGIIALMAMSQFADYQKKANDSIAINAILATRNSFEARIIDLGGAFPASTILKYYPGSSICSPSAATCSLNLPNFTAPVSTGLVLSSTATGYIIEAFHCNGVDRVSASYPSITKNVYGYNSLSASAGITISSAETINTNMGEIFGGAIPTGC